MCESTERGPQAGPQPKVKYCPNCKGDLDPKPTRNQDKDNAHKYQCDVCDRVFEINELERACARRDGQAS